MRSAGFLLGLLAPGSPGFVTAEDLDGPHAEAVARWQESGFIDRDPGRHPAPSCPHCGAGVPYQAQGRLLCDTCRSVIDPRVLLAWAVRPEAFLASLASHLGARGGVQTADGDLWELGTGTVDGAPLLCFHHPGGRLPEAARTRLSAYRRVLVFHGSLPSDPSAPGRWLPLVEMLLPDGTLAGVDIAGLLRAGGAVRFDDATGGLFVGSVVAGEVPVGSREWAFLSCLAGKLDQFVPYRDLKREVLRRTGGGGGAEEATFCQKLKSRIKERFVPGIDRLVVTTNKADGYRLRARGELS